MTCEQTSKSRGDLGGKLA